MLSNFSRSIRQKLRPDVSSPLLPRTISFSEDERHPESSQKRSFFLYKDDQPEHPPRDADHDQDDEDGDDETMDEDNEELEPEVGGSSINGEGDGEASPLLPIFSSDHLNALPVFSLTHAFREMVIDRCDTVLTWDQLRSPQVSQFLVKPIQQAIIDNYMNAATQYALLANCLQFTKEASAHPGNSGTNRTRSLLCELIAIKLLRECNTRELIDALSYDFDPLQGQVSEPAPAAVLAQRRFAPLPARISCIEIAIRANAKRFLAHPVVVQHLEAIWNGSIVFHSAADNMHRTQPMNQFSYGTTGHPSNASLFKLSRLRVPRYRNILSTVSFAVLLLLFLAVLQERSLEVSTLEIVFWVWAAGYMLDEAIGFNEQGFSLYIASFWNTFDVGILVLLFVHLCLRLYGVILPDDNPSKLHVAHRAYDVLATSAVLLFPRLFSVLDHYRYFSQLIIAFRMMAADMLAVFVLIVIFCSGFLVALTFAFNRGAAADPRSVAYALLQMLMGFTPAAWDRWDEYNWLGRMVLTLFLFICHFVVVTILITVLTNSFMEIVRNANEEHQYLFAVNVISNVKSDALFAYVPPLNVLQWLLTPLRYILPFRQYLKVNRTIIKVTHLPILWTIYLYERLVLRPRYVDTVDFVEPRGRVRKALSQRLPRLMREPSIATFRQDAALEEVFRQPNTMRTTRSEERRKSSNVVNSWMNRMGEEDAEPPQEEDRNIVEKLERRRFRPKRILSSQPRPFSISQKATSVVSDPNDFASHTDFFSPRGRIVPHQDLTPSAIDLPSQHTDADGDDELVTNDEDDTRTGTSNVLQNPFDTRSPRPGYVAKQIASQAGMSEMHDSLFSARSRQATTSLRGRPKYQSGREVRPRHTRNLSSATMIYNPPTESENEEYSPQMTVSATPKRMPLDVSGTDKSHSSKSSSPQTGRKTPKRQAQPQPGPVLPLKDNPASRSAPDIANLYSRPKPADVPNTSPNKPRPSLEMDLVSDIGDNKAIGGGFVGALPSSFASKMANATNAMRQKQLQLRQEEQKRQAESSEMLSRLMMARMNTLEEGFREVVHEVRESMRQATSGLASRQRSPERPAPVQKRSKEKKFRERKERSHLGSSAASGASKEDMERPKTGGSSSGKEKEVAFVADQAHQLESEQQSGAQASEPAETKVESPTEK